MVSVLQRLRLGQYIENFQRENITPDIVCLLSRQEMMQLGIKSQTDMMTLRNACVKFGASGLIRKANTDGPPKFEISKTVLQNLLETEFLISEISSLLSVSERTIYRRMQEFHLSKEDFTDIADDELRKIVQNVTQEFPNCGDTMLRQILRQNNTKIQRSRLRDILHVTDENGIDARVKRRLHRREYHVEGPNYIWHVDTNHKLIRWNFVIAGGVDGYSRLVVFLKCTDNNKAETVFRCFLQGVHDYGVHMKVRTDKGMENCKIADYS